MNRDSAAVARIAARSGLFINGTWCEGGSGRVIAVVDPSNESVVAEIPHADDADVARAIAAAERALPGWRATLAWERASLLRRTADLIRSRTDDLARTLTAEQGKPLAEARREVGMAADHFEWAGEEAKRIYGITIDARPAGTRSTVRHEPIGVVGALTPWNFPALQF